LITLFDVPISPYAQKVKLALLEKGLTFESKIVDLGNPDAEFSALSPKLEVPALADGEARLFDSSVILEYLEERYPAPPLLPEGALERARVRMLQELCDSQYEAIVWGIAELNVFGRAQGEQKEQMLARAKAQVSALNARLERELATRAYFNGEQPGFGDLVVYPHVNAAASQGNKPEPQGRLDAWLRSMRARPSAQRVKADVVATLAQFSGMAQRIATGQQQRQYRDHRLDWMMRSGGLNIVTQGLTANTLRFSKDV
jgi:glutathione S-transferase